MILLLLIVAADPIATASEKVVKLYGGSLGRIEGYGSGVLVSPNGHVLTTVSAMLQIDRVRAVLSDGRARDARIVAMNADLGLAMLKIDADSLPFFEIDDRNEIPVGSVIYAISNQFNIAVGDEQASVQRGVVSSRTRWSERQGISGERDIGEVLIVDCTMANPGSSGGALVNAQGALVGIIGRESKNPRTNTWINYALPCKRVAPFVANAKAGKTITTQTQVGEAKNRQGAEALRGIILLPDWFDNTPPYVDGVVNGSPAFQAGLKPDDLIMFLNEKVVNSAIHFDDTMRSLDPKQPAKLVVNRDGVLVTILVPGRP